VSQALSNTLWAYATLGRVPEAETWEALETAAVRVAPGMVPQALANTLWAYTSLSSLRDVILPLSYAAMWELMCNMEACDFIFVGSHHIPRIIKHTVPFPEHPTQPMNPGGY